jgi:D-alanyl-lipoteichoic acid acyltransferase DltB (MBOAT superfamily)
MVFDSTAYVLFLILVILLYWRLSFRTQNYFLLAASYFFYGWWDWRFLFLIAASTLADFLIARGMEASAIHSSRKRLLICALVLNFSFLGFFKYFNFFVDSFMQLTPHLGLETIPVSLWEIVLPPAISFYTFQEVA